VPGSQNNQYWMALALKLARKGFYSTDPNPRVGCVVVCNGDLIAQGWHEYAGGPHAEAMAIEDAAIPAGSDFYVTLEPCSHHGRTPPCVDELIKLKPRQVIIAMQDPNPAVAGQGIKKLEASGIRVIKGVLETEARMLNPGFISRMEKGRPLVRLKMALSLDGRTALKNGSSQWISGEPARRDVQFLRARSSAILTSATTVIKDNPLLNLRLDQQDLNQQQEVRQPVRVVVDSQLKLTGQERIFQTEAEIWVYTLSKNSHDVDRLTRAGAKVELVEESVQGKLNLSKMLGQLAKRGINELHTECGELLAGALISQQLVDEMVIYLAPRVMGSQSRGAFELGEILQMSDSVKFDYKDVRSIGDDLRLTLSLTEENH
jgi:diaminohydroxyphosphoribosylaminopyrimidine deaminase/5-amino-6-(5-phosphoribosylamino)uracil reductase